MNENVRKAQEEVRGLKSQVETLQNEKKDLNDTILLQKAHTQKMEVELNAARKENERCLSLTKELSSTKEASQFHEAEKLSLEQEIKELKKSHFEYMEEMTQKLKTEKDLLSSQQLQSEREKEEYMKDLEKKFMANEKESNVREDVLRREIEDLRKRWQDAVHRADGTCTSPR